MRSLVQAVKVHSDEEVKLLLHEAFEGVPIPQVQFGGEGDVPVEVRPEVRPGLEGAGAEEGGRHRRELGRSCRGCRPPRWFWSSMSHRKLRTFSSYLDSDTNRKSSTAPTRSLFSRATKASLALAPICAGEVNLSRDSLALSRLFEYQTDDM